MRGGDGTLDHRGEERRKWRGDVEAEQGESICMFVGRRERGVHAFFELRRCFHQFAAYTL